MQKLFQAGNLVEILQKGVRFLLISLCLTMCPNADLLTAVNSRVTAGLLTRAKVIIWIYCMTLSVWVIGPSVDVIQGQKCVCIMLM